MEIHHLYVSWKPLNHSGFFRFCLYTYMGRIIAVTQERVTACRRIPVIDETFRVKSQKINLNKTF